ncbi:TPA: hypothetical protein HA242_03675 [Candidatus Woesearchaeota archaeon]|nr:hypothetical protein [Candidatus Woesearchaeota archaeon]HIH12795.1 hypothetical protein [Candidatus Woesearchaeota archaeon]
MDQECCSMPVSQRLKEFCTQTKKYQLEWQMLHYAGLTLLILLALELAVYFVLWKNDPAFLHKRGWWILYLLLTIVFTAGALWHFKAHRVKVSCMHGMMIGMTLGVQSGLMLSVVIGSTNGMFMGGLLGMLFGVMIGVYAGRCGGIMGILEGAMAGVMGGTMGPMIALMMKNDHILWFMPPFMVINILILLGLSYMVYEEIAEKGSKAEKMPADFWTFFSYCFILTVTFTLIIVYGYKTAFVA